jgi:spore coat protein U-like protein
VAKRHLPSAVGALIMLGIHASPINAATVGTTLAVSATVQATCTVAASPSLAFGTYIPTAASTANTTISVTCTNGTPYDIGLDKGANGSSVTARQMKNGTATLNYSLTRDSAGTLNFGQTVGTDTVHGTATGVAIATTVYGQIASGQYAIPGSYTDTVNVTVTY